MISSNDLLNLVSKQRGGFDINRIEYVLSYRRGTKLSTDSGLIFSSIGFTELEKRLPKDKFITINTGILIAMDRVISVANDEISLRYVRFSLPPGNRDSFYKALLNVSPGTVNLLNDRKIT